MYEPYRDHYPKVYDDTGEEEWFKRNYHCDRKRHDLLRKDDNIGACGAMGHESRVSVCIVPTYQLPRRVVTITLLGWPCSMATCNL